MLPVPPDVDGGVVFEQGQDDGHFDGGDEPICVWGPMLPLKRDRKRKLQEIEKRPSVWHLKYDLCDTLPEFLLCPVSIVIQ